MSESGHEDIRHHIKTYIGVFVVLMVLTVVTVAVSYVHLAVGLAVTVAMIVATIKGSLVATYFMHLKAEQPAIYWLLGLTVVFWVLVMFLPLLTQLDTIAIP
jgi:cytochrome c oxidase subunit 4